MNVLILGGNSPQHKQWIRDVQAALEPDFDEVRVLDYKHWGTGDKNANIEHEIVAASELVADWDSYAVVAKSVGTVIAVLAHARGLLDAKTYILLGVPIDGIAGQAIEFTPSLTTLPHSSIVQNSNDPFGSAEKIRALLAEHGLANIQLVETPGNTHDYLDYATIKQYL